MDDEPEIVSFGRADGARPAVRWPWLVVLACLMVAVAHLAIVTSQRDVTIGHLRAALRTAQAHDAGAPAAAGRPVTGPTAFHRFPDGRHGWFSVVATAISARPGAAPTLWLFIHGHAEPGQRYGLLGDMCGGEFVTASDWAQATADRHGNLTIVAPGVSAQPASPRLYLVVYQLDSGVTLGGIKGPLAGAQATPFRRSPACGRS